MKLTTVEKVILLQRVDLFEEVPTRQLAYLAAVADEARLSSDEVVYREGDSSDGLYLVVEGEVVLEKDGRTITVAGPDDAFGSWSLFDDEPRVVTATARVDSRVLKVAKDDFIDLLADHVKITQGILRKMAQRMRGLLERTGG